jgi:hypothetical protein
MKQFVFLSLLMLGLLGVQAQILTPAASPTATFSQQVGLTDVSITYSRPSAKGRTIFGDSGIVRYGETWRTGANAATKFSFSKDVMLGGVAVKKGDYAVLTVPGASQWKVMLYPYESSNFMAYVEKEPVASFSVDAVKMSGVSVETFLINIDNVTASAATIDLIWASTYVAIPLTVATDDQVMASIEKTMAGPSANDFYAAGSYYHDSGKDLEKALEWVQKATKGENPGFWQVRKESLILADLGRNKEAIAAAKRSLDMAKAAGNMDYVRMNEASIAAWTAKK